MSLVDPFALTIKFSVYYYISVFHFGHKTYKNGRN